MKFLKPLVAAFHVSGILFFLVASAIFLLAWLKLSWIFG
jgi:hypothetical protein|tara:strand:- start:573 stop:689 length:117 start_codon:yes stop_codon:yes gene_type:complete